LDSYLGVKAATMELASAESFQKSSGGFDNMFGDLENVFGCLAGCLTCCCSCRGNSVMKLILLLPRLVAFTLLFVIFFALVVTIILPSMFWLLLVRARTVETESSKFEGSVGNPVAAQLFQKGKTCFSTNQDSEKQCAGFSCWFVQFQCPFSWLACQ
jgi:hypothetical protein